MLGIPTRLRNAFACLALYAALSAISVAGARAAEPVVGSFSLVAHTGEPLSNADLLGRPYAVFFGFTYCPDVCPTALFDVAQVLEKLGPDGDGIVPLFITVDPDRDTPDVLRDYVGAFDTRIIGLRGSHEQTAATARAFRATYEKVEHPDGSYNINHTAVVYLMDRHGRFFDIIDYNAPLEQQFEKYRAVINVR